MKQHAESPTKQRLLDAAAELVSGSPNQDVPIRAICERAGVQLPTLYHYFGSKDGLMDALVSFAFESYLNAKSDQPRLADPIEVLRRGWDNHVEFGLQNPQLYALMYGRTHPGGRPSAAREVERLLLLRTQEAFAAGRLKVHAELAAAQILSTNIGVTLALITEATELPDLRVSESVRDLLLGAISRAADPDVADAAQPWRSVIAKEAADLAAALDIAQPEQLPLHPRETALLRHWLQELG
ncbi:MAG: TetR/AcrR family transcriptional regulator [Renibacterium sp.]|nr:TetR/AcrR family transcriptional regulator [Renibacterium sp.]